jgi:hypothetical protein
MRRAITKKSEAWRNLQVNDSIRFVRLPSNLTTLHPETYRLYAKLIKRGRPQRVFQIDEYGLPWIYCRFRLRNGKWEHHWLAVNDDSWVKVKKHPV